MSPRPPTADRPPQPDGPIETAELDELYTYIYIEHKNACDVVTEVERATRRIVSGAVRGERTWAARQGVVEGADPATRSSSNGVATYETLVYDSGRHAVALGKSQTYSVEADTAEVRRGLACHARRSRYFCTRSRPDGVRSRSSCTPGTAARCTSGPSHVMSALSLMAYAPPVAAPVKVRIPASRPGRVSWRHAV